MNLPDKITLHFDGACEPKNPGGWATFGWIICGADGAGIKQTGFGTAYPKGHVLATNNVAEYAGLLDALQWLAAQSWYGEMAIYGDSKLVVEQVNENWKCNKDHLQKLRSQIWEILDRVCSLWTIAWVPREQNEAADSLSRQAYEASAGEKFPERRRA